MGWQWNQVYSDLPNAYHFHFDPVRYHTSTSTVITNFLWTGFSSWHPTNSVKALKADSYHTQMKTNPYCTTQSLFKRIAAPAIFCYVCLIALVALFNKHQPNPNEHANKSANYTLPVQSTREQQKLQHSSMKNKKPQLSLTNPRDVSCKM